jgi:VanZ family protein
VVNKIKDFFRRYWGEIGLVLFVWLIFRGSGDPNFSAGFWQLWLERAFSLSPQHAYLIVFVVRKAGHLAGYGLLALCLKRVLGKRLPGVSPAGLFWLALSGVALLAVTDETLQVFSVYRSGVWYDILLDLLGATVALWAAGQNSFFSRSLYGRKS